MSQPGFFNKIKNPDVPGMENNVPPPPIISENSSDSVPFSGNTNNNATNLVSYPQLSSGSLFSSSAPVPPSPQANQPWWTPNETDSEVYTQWYETAYKAALKAAQEKDASGKPKTKYYKRKLDQPIDPKTDAERVANAQKELSALMKPLKCDLCNAVMNSTVQAKLHYQGKPHQKKVSMYLNQSAKKVKAEDGQVSSTTSDWNAYCEICKIWFTSQTDATQHYAGKKHLKAAYGTSKPKPKKPQQNKIPIDPSGRYGIGMAFQPQVDEPMPLEPQIPEKPPVVVPPIPQYAPPLVAYPLPLQCDICGISVNRQDQLDTHKRGAKHLKMMKLHGMADKETPAVGPIDYSIYRTPSGQYYCAPCNLSLNSEVSFGQHMESKKHKLQVNPKQQASQSSGPPAKKQKKK